MNIIEVIPYGCLIAFAIWSIYYIFKYRKTPEKANPYLFDSIPQVFPTIGILGTFLGIASGLYFFDTKNMADSIPLLLDGLKVAFYASIAGILGLLIFSKVIENIQGKNEKDKTTASDEVTALNLLINQVKESSEKNSENFKLLNESLIGDSDESLATQFAKMRNQMNEQSSQLSKIQSALGGDGETSLLTQIQKLRAEQNDYSKLTSENTTLLVETMNENNDIIKSKFDEFAKLLTENNTKALVEAMEKVITDFNTQMNELIQRLVKENFEELNNSVKSLNEWQKINKEQVATLTGQFNQVVSNLESSSQNIDEISKNTKYLTDSNSVLSLMIKELQSVLVEDRKFTDMIETLKSLQIMLKFQVLSLQTIWKKKKDFNNQ